MMLRHWADPKWYLVCVHHLWKPTGGQNTRGLFNVGLDMLSNMFQQTLPARRDPVLLPHTIAGFCWLPAKIISPITYRGAVNLAFGNCCCLCERAMSACHAAISYRHECVVFQMRRQLQRGQKPSVITEFSLYWIQGWHEC